MNGMYVVQVHNIKKLIECVREVDQSALLQLDAYFFLVRRVDTISEMMTCLTTNATLVYIPFLHL
jgi:hypothetical protein